MKDAFGHGSGSKGSLADTLRKRFAGRGLGNTSPSILKSASNVTNQDAAVALRSEKGGGPAPVHPAQMDRAGSRDFDAFGRPRDDASKAEYDEGSRDLALRSRNGQVGSGMSYRG